MSDYDAQDAHVDFALKNHRQIADKVLSDYPVKELISEHIQGKLNDEGFMTELKAMMLDAQSDLMG